MFPPFTKHHFDIYLLYQLSTNWFLNSHNFSIHICGLILLSLSLTPNIVNYILTFSWLDRQKFFFKVTGTGFIDLKVFSSLIFNFCSFLLINVWTCFPWVYYVGFVFLFISKFSGLIVSSLIFILFV